MALGEKIKAFGGTPIGFVVYLAIIVLLAGYFVGELGIPVGALLMLLVSFGLPIYFGWKTSLRKLLIVAVAVLLFAPLVTGVVVTQMAVVPSPVSWSGDNVLQNGSVDPYMGAASGQTYHFQVQVWPSHLGPNLTLKAVYLWVTNCAYDTSNTQGTCYLTPHDPFTNLSQKLSPAQQNSTVSPFMVYFNSSSLPKGQILYFMFLTAVASVGSESQWIYGLSAHYGGWSCTVPGGPPAGYSGCSYTQGPITGGWGSAYFYLLPDFYLSMALLVGVLVAVMLVYTYLKGRERMRLAKAKASAGGESETAPVAELRCPHCHAVVDKGETSCWKCKKSLSSPPEKAPLPSGGTTGSGKEDSSQPLSPITSPGEGAAKPETPPASEPAGQE